MRTYDVIVVGGGPAGLSAALLLGRARRRVAVIDVGHPRNGPATHLHGYLTRDGTPPAELLAIGRDEVAHYGGTLIDAQVETIAGCVGAFTVSLATGEVLTGRRLLVATGLTDRLPAIPGLAQRWGRDVLHCPYCHGHEVADCPLAVLNSGPEAVQQAMTIRHWSPHVTLLTHGTHLRPDDQATLAANHIEVATTPVSRAIAHDDRLVGIWAAGNVTDPTAQFITAAGDGARAAIDIITDLIAVDAAARTHVHT